MQHSLYIENMERAEEMKRTMDDDQEIYYYYYYYLAAGYKIKSLLSVLRLQDPFTSRPSPCP